MYNDEKAVDITGYIFTFKRPFDKVLHGRLVKKCTQTHTALKIRGIRLGAYLVN